MADKEDNKNYRRNISDELKDSYLDYAMSVIISRALPDIRDGLKPVQRRILFAMYKMGLQQTTKFRKSASVVGECFAKDTLVSTKEGLKPIQSIEVGNQVYTQEGLRKVIQLFEMPKKSLLKVGLENGVSNVVTPSQKFKVLTSNWKTEWKEAKDLQQDDYLVVKADYPEIKNLVKLVPIKQNQPFYLDKEIAYFLGMFVSEGSISNDYGKKKLPRIGITNNSLEIIRKLVSVLDQKFAYQPTIEVKNYQLKNKQGKIINNKRYFIRINRKSINKFFVSNFKLEGKKAFTKDIPSQIFLSPKEVIFAFVSGLIDGDGSVHKNRKVIHYGSISEKLINQLQVLLLSQEIFTQKYKNTKLKKHYLGNQEIISRHPFYWLEASGENVLTLSSKLVLFSPIRKERVSRLQNSPLTGNDKKGFHKFDIIPYAGKMLFSELSKNHLGGGWYQDIEGNKFRRGIKYPQGNYNKIRYSSDLWGKPLRKTQVIDWGIAPKLERMGSPLFEFLESIMKNKIYFFKVSSIDKVAPERTYDLEVEDDHEFVANGMISHNCLGKYHPHGDLSVYDATVRMAQVFSLRYPLVEGQGNFGSVDGDPPAAPRYTECRLSKIAEEMLTDIEKDTVDFVPNYDGTRKEPSFLPSKIPQFLLNGAMGIAVGMATNIPPHNLTEVTNALLLLIDHPQSSLKEIMKFIKGPDFPTGGIIFGQQNILEAYAQGKGTIVCRGKTEIQEEDKGSKIIITEIPYQVNKATLVANIAHLVEEKKITGIKNLRDESDKDGLRVVIELKPNTEARRVLGQVFKYTELEKSFHLNMLALVENGRQPQILSIKNALEEYIEHRKNVVRRRTLFLLQKAQERAHILEGLDKALNHIDAIIKLIKSSSSREDAKNKLMAKYHFSIVQTDAILEMKLQSLAKLERVKVENELKEKRKEIKEYQSILKEPRQILKIIKEELQEIQTKYGDARRTKVEAPLPDAISQEELIPSQETLITFSHSGYIKRMRPLGLKGQKRGGKGVIGYEAKNEDDFLTFILSCNTRDNLLFFTDQGHVFRLQAYEIEETSRTARGKSIQNYLNLRPQEKIRVIFKYSPSATNLRYLILATEKGTIKRTFLEEYKNVRRGGLAAINLTSNDKLVGAALSQGDNNIVLVTQQGQAIRFPEKNIRPLRRVATGVRGIKLAKNDKVISLISVSSEESKFKPTILVISSNGFGKKTNLTDYRSQARGGKGIKTAKITERTGSLVRACLIKDEESLVAISRKGQIIKSSLNEVSVLRRSTQGVRIMKMASDDAVADITLLL